MSINVKLDIFPFTNQGKRQYQEDYLYTDPVREGRPWLGIVSDGMGGHQGGDVASQSGVHAIYRAFDAAISARQPIKEALDSSVTKGHQAVLKAAEKVNAVGDMGATVAAFVIDGTKLYWCSAGDSRVYLIRQGRIKQLSRDHNLAEDMREGLNKGEWTLEDIQNNPQKNALTSFMGSDNWRMDSRSTVLQPGDIIVACSDGVYGTIGDDGIEAACHISSIEAKTIADRLLKNVLDVGKTNQDNCTAIVVHYKPESDIKPMEKKTNRLPYVLGLLFVIVVGIGWLLHEPLLRAIYGQKLTVDTSSKSDISKKTEKTTRWTEHLTEIEKSLNEKTTNALADEVKKRLSLLQESIEGDGLPIDFERQNLLDRVKKIKERIEELQAANNAHESMGEKTVTGDKAKADAAGKAVTGDKAKADAAGKAVTGDKAKADAAGKAVTGDKAKADAAGKAVTADKAKADAAGKAVTGDKAKADAAKAVAGDKVKADTAGKAVTGGKVKTDTTGKVVTGDKAKADAAGKAVTGDKAKADAAKAVAGDKVKADTAGKAVTGDKANADAAGKTVAGDKVKEDAAGKTVAGDKAKADAAGKTVAGDKTEMDADTAKAQDAISGK